MAYDAGGRASVGEWERMPLPDGVVFTRYDGDRTIFFTDRNGMLFRFDTGQRRAFPIFDLREELGRRGALSSVISDKDDYVLAFGMSGVLRLRSTDPIEGRYELQEIDVNCGVFALLKDCNQDIVWIGTDGSGLLRQAVGEVAIRSVTYETLPYLLTKPIKGAPCRPGGRPLDRDQERRHPAHPRFLLPADLYAGEYRQLYGRPIRRWGKIRSIRLPEAAAMCCGSAATAACATTRTGTGGFSNCRGAGRCGAFTGFTRTGTGCCGLRAWATGSGASNCPGSADARVAANVEPVELGLKARSRNFFFSVCEESDSTLWFCNHGIGVVHYDRRTREGRTVGFDTRRGLAVNDVTAGVCRSDGSSWFGTGCGLVRYDPAAAARNPITATTSCAAG